MNFLKLKDPKLFSIIFEISKPKFSILMLFLILTLVFSSEKKGDTEIGIGSRLPLVISISTSEKPTLGFKIAKKIKIKINFFFIPQPSFLLD